MEAVEARRAAALLFLFFSAAAPKAQDARGAENRIPTYAPMSERLEILQPWEKRPGAEGSSGRIRPSGRPEIVAGIYELDYRRYDFRNEVVITIDDCAPNKYMATELDILKKRGVKAVFFIIGSYFFFPDGRPMPRAKELLDRVVGEGHEIGSHSFWHKRLDEGRFRDDRGEIDAELDRNQAAIDKVLGYHYPIRYFRPPNGAHSTPGYAVDRALLAKGQYLTNWTITSFDWNIRYPPGNPERLSPEKVIARTVKQAREESGGVVLLHGFPTTASLLDRLLAALASAGNERGPLTFSTLDEIMRLKYEERGKAGSGAPITKGP
jgi:peptidoglycan/xylan/chitin deacetylase (PgdA/CDA1 family)